MNRRSWPQSLRRVVVAIKPDTFTEIRNAAKETRLGIAAYVAEVLEADVAARRLSNPPLPSGRNADPQRPATPLRRSRQ